MFGIDVRKAENGWVITLHTVPAGDPANSQEYVFTTYDTLMNWIASRIPGVPS
jgi:hypothetical protein